MKMACPHMMIKIRALTSDHAAGEGFLCKRVLRRAFSWRALTALSEYPWFWGVRLALLSGTGCPVVARFGSRQDLDISRWEPSQTV